MRRMIQIAFACLLLLAPGPVRAEDEPDTAEAGPTPWAAVRDGLRNENVKKPPFRNRQARERHQEVPAAIEAALTWLADHQSGNGGWEAYGFHGWSQGVRVPPTNGSPGRGLAIHDVGVTGLALTAFLVAGYTGDGEHAFDTTVRKGLTYLKSVQDGEGCFGRRVVSPVPQSHGAEPSAIRVPGSRFRQLPSPIGAANRETYVYNHAAAALAMVEAYGMTGRADWKASAQRGLDFIALARNPYFVWRYGIKPGENDTSVTAWMMLPLQTALFINRAEVSAGMNAPFRIDVEAFDGIRAWIDKMTDPDNGRTGYILRGGPVARPTAEVDHFPADESEATTAAGMLARVFLGEDPQRSAIFLKGFKLLEKHPPIWNGADGSIDMIYWHFATLAVHQMGVRRKVGNPKHARKWGEWLRVVEASLLDHQRKDGPVADARGSWDPVGAWGKAGGRVYATALDTLTLLTPVRYERRAK